jgi:hypothetical protein
VIADLRHRRREMRRELARVRWWRQLVKARRDLTIAGLAQPGSVESVGMDASWEALAADAPTSKELTQAVWPHGVAESADSLAALDSLDLRLETYEARVSENLETVTAQMVTALGSAHRVNGAAKERDHA